MTKILEVKNIFKSFGFKTVHEGVSFYLNKGETIGLLGPSGTGKSVLLRSIIGLEEIDEGEIIYHGKRIDNLPEEDLYPIRTQISYSFQNGALFDSESIFENVAYPLFEHTKLSEIEIQEKVLQVLKIVNMDGSQDLMPSDLSGGMQKRVGLARAMILNPEILLYDEPTAGLDPSNIELIISIMQKFKQQGISGILVTHDISTALKICDRILILKDGVINFSGSIYDFENSTDSFVKTFLKNE
jgi:phospholipid/cholesterol/gamma-HCH transport system ATP-binding protein